MSLVKNGRILLVEPSTLSGSIIVSTARQLNLSAVHLVSSVRSAQQKLDQEDFAGVIVSLEEDHDSILLIERLRSVKFSAVNPQVPVAVITSSINASLALQMKVFDVRRVLLKPFKVRDVITTIQMLQQAR
ncbi:MAG: histidine kinase [Rhodoferax sp.]|jgi:CheY-like chemotaxis protein